jgi:hypothetical protein
MPGRRATGHLLPVRLLAGVLLFAAAASPLVGQQAMGGSVPGGDGILYIGTYGREIVRLDERTGEILAPIPMQGIPRTIVPNPAGNRFYVLDTSYETVEVVDVAGARVERSFTLSSGPTNRVRIWGMTLDPLERHAIFLTKRTRAMPDRFQVEEPVLIRWDIQAGRVADTIPWPGGHVRDAVRMMYAPDGELLYFFAEDAILALETDGFTEVDRWEYGTALDEEMGRFEFGFPEQSWGNPGEMVGLFRTTDMIQGRRTMGVASVRLNDRRVQFTPLGPNESVSFTLAPGGRRAYGLQQEVGNWHFWTFDLEAGRVANRARFAGRPRMSLQVSSNGRLLYIYNAGNTIDVYDTDGYALLRTIDLPGDNTTPLFILPRDARTGSAGR